MENKKTINITQAHYRKMLRDSERLLKIKGLIKNLYDIVKATKEPKDYKVNSIKEETVKGRSAVCTKCGDEILGDTDSLCQNCV